jgi:hypothetical protein
MISQRQFATIVRLVEDQGLDGATISRLRGMYPGMHFTHCLDEEINHIAPVQERPGFNVYLVDSRQHCLRLTRDFELASGLVLAEVID